MTKYELEQFLKEKHTFEEVLQVLHSLSAESSLEYEQAMEREDVYAIGFTSGTHIALEKAIALIETLK